MTSRTWNWAAISARRESQCTKSRVKRKGTASSTCTLGEGSTYLRYGPSSRLDRLAQSQRSHGALMTLGYTD